MAIQRPMNAECTVEAENEREAFRLAHEAWDEGKFDGTFGYIDEDYVSDDTLDLSDPDDPNDPWNPDGTSGVHVEEVE